MYLAPQLGEREVLDFEVGNEEFVVGEAGLVDLQDAFAEPLGVLEQEQVLVVQAVENGDDVLDFLLELSLLHLDPELGVHVDRQQFLNRHCRLGLHQSLLHPTLVVGHKVANRSNRLQHRNQFLVFPDESFHESTAVDHILLGGDIHFGLIDEVLHFLQDVLLELLLEALHTFGELQVQVHDQFESGGLSRPQDVLQSIGRVEQDLLVGQDQFFGELFVDEGVGSEDKAGVCDFLFVLVQVADFIEVLAGAQFFQHLELAMIVLPRHLLVLALIGSFAT